MTIVVPVSDWSLCVTPCWTRSPTTISRMKSNGSICPSSRRPAARVTTRMRKKTKTVRRTRSMGSGHHGDRARDAGDRPLGVVELDREVAAAGLGGVDLELHPDRQGVAGGELAVGQD